MLKLELEQVEVIGKPIPACESEPISHVEQAQNMAEFLAGISAQLDVPAAVVAGRTPLISDPNFTHWVVGQGQIVGEAREAESNGYGSCFVCVRLFGMPENAEHGHVDPSRLHAKKNAKLA